MNEEDIKILEKFISEVNKMKDTDNEWHGYMNDEMHVLKRAIENLINRNKELKETLKDNWEFRDKCYIPKSKIKEKIEELKQEYKIELEKKSIKAFILKCKIEALEELLQEGE